MPSRSIAFAGVLTATFWIAGCVVQVDSHRYVEREEARFTVSGIPDVEVSTFDGAIKVRSWDRDEVLVEVEKAGSSKQLLDAIKVVKSQDGQRIRVEVRGLDRTDRAVGLMVNASWQARVFISAPRRTNLQLRTDDGSLAAERITGRVDLRTRDGSIRGLDLEGDVLVDSGDGSVKLEDVVGRVDARTHDGSMNITGRLERLSAHTGDGGIVLRVEPGSAVGGSWELSTGDGSVVLYLPRQLDAVIDADTGDGRVRIDQELGARVVQGAEAEPGAETRARVLRAQLGGGGGGLIRIHTNNGSIRVKPR